MSYYTRVCLLLALDINLMTNLQSTLDRAAPDAEGSIQVINQRPACLIVAKMTPIFTRLLEKIGPDQDILNSICQFYDKSVRTMVEHGVTVIAEISNLLTRIIAQAPSAAAVDLVHQIITLYYKEKPVSHCRAHTKLVNYFPYYFCYIQRVG